MKFYLHTIFISVFVYLFAGTTNAQLSNNCANAIQVCNNQLAEQLDDGFGTQECPTGGCGCMLAGEKNTRWFKIVVATGGTLEFTIRPYNGSADYDFSVWNQGTTVAAPYNGACPSGPRLGSPDRCNFAAPASPTGIVGTTNGNSNGASGNLFSNNMTVTAGQVIYIMIDNYDGTQEGFYLDFFGGTPGSGKGTTATFNCSGVNQCTSCTDADCKSYYFASPDNYSFDETAANGACHSNFGYASVKTATVCGTFTVPAPFTTVQFPTNRGYEVTTTNGANTTTCLNSANITYQVWDNCAAAPLVPSSPGIYNGLNNVTSYKVCKTITVTGADCWLSRVCLPYWTMVQNDVACSATPLTVNAAAVSGTNAGASSDFDAGCTGYQDVFYSFVAPASGRVQVNVTPNGTSDVKVSVLGPQAGLSGGVNDCNLSCNAITESNIAGGCNDEAGTGGAERLFTFVIPGQTYYVWISGTLFRPTATFTVQVTETLTSTAVPQPGPDLVGAPDPIPANDQCANATNLNLCVAQPGTNIGATAECTDPDPVYVDALTLENDVWYKWTAPANNGNSEVTLTVTGISCTGGMDGSTGIQFGIFRGSCAALTPVIDGTTSLTFTPIPGQTYYFVIDGNAGAQCNFTIEVKRPRITAQSCTPGSVCAGDPISASFSVQYYGSNPGAKWAYCKSPIYGTPCTIDIDNPATYSIYNPAVGLPDPGCTPATYTFVGYILADNGQTTFGAPYTAYPLPQPSTASCLRQTTACTFNIYPDIDNYVTVIADGCRQIVRKAGTCPATLTLTPATDTNQTVAVGTTSGNFNPVTIGWAAPYNTGAPGCATRVVQTPRFCPTPASDGPCIARPLIVGAATLASNNNVALNTNEQIACGTSNSAGYGVWFSFVAPPSGNVDIQLTAVGTGDNLDAQIYWVSSRRASDIGGCDADGSLYSDQCSNCLEFNTDCNIIDHGGWCSDGAGLNGNETLQLRGLWPGETHYIMIDGYDDGFFTPTSEMRGNFSIRVIDAGSGPVRPTNDNCANAINLSDIGCGETPGTNVAASSLCNGDPTFTGATTENSVWYIYVPQVTGPHTIRYLNASGYDCMGHLNQTLFDSPFSSGGAGIQFTMYTSNTNDCNGTFTEVPGSVVSTGNINGAVNLNLTAGQKYYIMIDGFAGNECTYKFQINNNEVCCSADLGAVEKGDTILCYGEETTLGVTADPILFGNNSKDNPVIAWQFSPTQPTGASLDPFHPSNAGLGYYPGQIDIVTPGTTISKTYTDYDGNTTIFPAGGYGSTSFGTGNCPTFRNVVIDGFPSGAQLQNVNNIKVCVYFGAEDMGNLDVSLINPSGTSIDLFSDVCNESAGGLSVCFTAAASGVIPGSGGVCPPTGGSPQFGATNDELQGDFRPDQVNGFTNLVGGLLNGTWQLRICDDDADLEGGWFFGWTLDLSYTQNEIGPPVVGPRHGDLNIINNDPFKYGPQEFWLTPVTMIDYDPATGLFTKDTTCYDYGPPTKITLLERVTTPLVNPTCAAPGDGSNGVSLTVTSPTGGLPGLPAAPANGTLSFSNTTAINPITDNNLTFTNRDITVSGFNAGATLTAATNITVCVTFSPAHPFAGDIDLQLIAPNGGILSLTQDRGNNGNLSGQYCFVSTGALLPSPGDVNIPTGNYLWDGTYANIANTLLNGLWRLQIRDDATGDVGGISGWTLSLTGLVPSVSSSAYTVIGSGAASSITFPSPPVQESETSNPFNVLDGQAWNVRFVDAAGCESEIGGTYNQPNLGTLQLDTNVCDGVQVAFSTSNPIPLFSQYRVILDFDSYPQDVSWFIYDGNNQVVASGGGYGTTAGAATYTSPATINPDNGPYRFVLYDGFDDGFGSGGGSTNNGGQNTINFIRVVEIHADGTVDTLFSQNYAFCTPIYCVGPAPSVFGQLNVNLGTPTGTFSTGVSVTLENNRTCTGATVVGAITMNQDGTGTVNTNAAGVNAGSSYSIQYQYTDQYGCVKQICGPLDVFPTISLAPTVNCATSPPTVSVNATCTGCNATYIAEYSFNGGATWTTSITGNFQDLYIFAHIKNTVTGVIGCEVQSAKLGTCATVLPIEFVYAKAEPINNEYIKVSWATASEVNSSRFDIWRSEDAVNFSKIGTVSALGTSAVQHNYAYDDYRVQKGITYYYKIIEVDIDGREQHSNVVNARLTIDGLEIVGIYPNPVVESATISIVSKDKDVMRLVVYNDLGQVMLNEDLSLKAGENSITIDMKTWANGVYYFNMKNDLIKPVIKKVLKKD